MPVVNEDEVRAGVIEAKMKGTYPPFRCPLCWSEASLDSNEVPYGEGYITEFKYIECPVCDIVFECKKCYRYILYKPENHPCSEKLLQAQMCKCPQEIVSNSSTRLVSSIGGTVSVTLDELESCLPKRG